MKTKNKADWIPEKWTFDDRAVALRFEAHVREQLPWYDLLTATIVHAAAHYVPRGGLVYDVGASLGNFGRAFAPYLRDRDAVLWSIERSKEMGKAAFQLGLPPGRWSAEDALAYDFQPYDFAVLNLVLMFMPIGERARFVDRMRSLLKPGGALVIVDKIVAPPGYLGTVFRRMAMKWKLDAGASAEEIVAKELSLAGAQRPIHPDIIPVGAQKFFQFGEFAGWIIDRAESGIG